jgi:hypothetical protein
MVPVREVRLSAGAGFIVAICGEATGPRRRDLLIEHLHLIQDAHGHLSAAHLRALAEEMRLSHGRGLRGRHLLRPFRRGEGRRGAAARADHPGLRFAVLRAWPGAGAEAALEDGLDPAQVRVLRAPCMGRCDTAPVLELGHNHIDHATPEKVAGGRRAGDTHADPRYQTLDAYRAAGGYATLDARCARNGGDWEAVQETMLTSGCAGSAARAFPRAQMGLRARRPGRAIWPSTATRASRARSRTATTWNATPHLFLEGMLIAAWAVEAERCYIYMRDEYPAVLEILRREIAALEEAGICAPGYIDLRRGAGPISAAKKAR